MIDIASSQPEPREEPASFDPRRVGRFLLYTAVVTFCLAALTSIGVILFGEFGRTEGRILLSSFSIAAYSLAGLIATTRFGRDPRLLAPLGLGSATLGLILTLILIWAGTDSEFLARVTFSVMVLAAAMAHANLLLADPERDDPAAPLLAGTLVVNAIVTAMIVLPILFSGDPDGGVYWKSLAVFGVLLVLGTLIVPVVRKIKDGGPATAAPLGAPEPAWMGLGEETLEVRYRGRTFHVRAESVAGDPAGFTAITWVASGPGLRPVTLGPDAQSADSHTALGLAVQEIARAVDEGRL